MLKSYSWIIDGKYAIKSLDKSALLHRETGIPKDIAHFFQLNESAEGREIVLLYQEIAYPAKLTIDPLRRFKITWKKDFALKLQYKFSSYVRLYEDGRKEELSSIETNLMRFKAVVGEVDTFEVELFNVNVEQEQVVLKEGRQLQYLLTRYERSSVIREKAISIHGYYCAACNFNFEEIYGEIGADFIEVHHVNPLSKIKEEYEVNPTTDLVPLCANCHRMVHRDWSEVMPIEVLKEHMENQKNIR